MVFFSSIYSEHTPNKNFYQLQLISFSHRSQLALFKHKFGDRAPNSPSPPERPWAVERKRKEATGERVRSGSRKRTADSTTSRVRRWAGLASPGPLESQEPPGSPNRGCQPRLDPDWTGFPGGAEFGSLPDRPLSPAAGRRQIGPISLSLPNLHPNFLKMRKKAPWYMNRGGFPRLGSTVAEINPLIDPGIFVWWNLTAVVHIGGNHPVVHA